MKQIAAHVVPKDKNIVQKFNLIRVVEDTLECVNLDPTFMKCIITDNKM